MAEERQESPEKRDLRARLEARIGQVRGEAALRALALKMARIIVALVDRRDTGSVLKYLA